MCKTTKLSVALLFMGASSALFASPRPGSGDVPTRYSCDDYFHDQKIDVNLKNGRYFFSQKKKTILALEDEAHLKDILSPLGVDPRVSTNYYKGWDIEIPAGIPQKDCQVAPSKARRLTCSSNVDIQVKAYTAGRYTVGPRKFDVYKLENIPFSLAIDIVQFKPYPQAQPEKGAKFAFSYEINDQDGNLAKISSNHIYQYHDSSPSEGGGMYVQASCGIPQEK